MPGKVKLASHVDVYLTSRRARGAKPQTIKGLTSILNRFCNAWDDTRRSPNSITGGWVEDYLVSLDVKPATLAVYENSIRIFLRWCAVRGHVQASAIAWDKVGGSTSGRGRKYIRLEQSQLVDLYTGCDHWYFRGVMATLVFTACRSGELQIATVGDIDLDALRVAWARPKIDDYDDRLPINEQYLPELRRYLTRYAWAVREEHGRDLRKTDYLFPRFRTFGRTHIPHIYPTQKRDVLWPTVQKQLARVMRVPEGELPDREGAHTIRRSVATHLYVTWKDAGLHDPVGRVQALLGHKNRATTERYIGLTALREARDEAVTAMPFFTSTTATVVDIAHHRERA